MDTDVVIVGGGLAGLTLARQLRLEAPDVRVVVLERGQRPAREAAYKVGESSVEVGAHYFAERLGLREHIETEQLPKLGLRFFFPQGDNSDIARRFEIGPMDYPTVPSYQLDRGRFENYIHDLNVKTGVTIFDRARVQAVEINPGGLHEVKFLREGEVQTVRARWLVDAAGRNFLLKRKFGLQKESPLNNGSVWFRIDAELDVSDLSRNPSWLDRTNSSKRFSTNHVMGPGYWVWFIPLGSGATSVGIVFDNEMHNFKELSSFDKALEWLRRNEPQCAELIERNRDKLQDFLGYANYSHSCKQVYSEDRWCITGEAGVFVDPFYSPGSDFIAYSNDFVADLIRRDMSGEDVRVLTRSYNDIFLRLADVVFTIYEGLYPKFGNPFVMTQKILWDSAVYLGVTCLLYFNRKLNDLTFLKKIDADLARYNDLLHTVGQHFKRQPLHHTSTYEGEYVDLSKTFLFGINLNKELLIKYASEDDLAAKVRYNISMLEQLSKDIFANRDISGNFSPTHASMPSRAIA